MADLTSQAAPATTRVPDSIRLGRIKGLIHYLIIYELSYHWMKKRLPFPDEKELLEFIYFDTYDLDPELAVEASRIKLLDERILRNADNVIYRELYGVVEVTDIEPLVV